ncbi:hypothetical protein Ddc_09184 [Ditylenchus destructor]|nr:hypothetical protein Ddc_09184 [Ditylenchus destructor]
MSSAVANVARGSGIQRTINWYRGYFREFFNTEEEFGRINMARLVGVLNWSLVGSIAYAIKRGQNKKAEGKLREKNEILATAIARAGIKH